MRLLALASIALFACGGGSTPIPTAPADKVPAAQSSSIEVVVTVVGDSDHALVVSDPPGISCSTSCAASFPRGTTVRLAAATSICGFEWQGPCSGWGGPCLLDGASDVHVTLAIATMCPLPPVGLLSVAVSGRGRVTMGNVAIDCGTVCNAAVRAYESVVLVAKPQPGATFLGWGGACTGTADCRFVFDHPPMQVSAAFSP